MYLQENKPSIIYTVKLFIKHINIHGYFWFFTYLKLLNFINVFNKYLPITNLHSIIVFHKTLIL